MLAVTLDLVAGKLFCLCNGFMILMLPVGFSFTKRRWSLEEINLNIFILEGLSVQQMINYNGGPRIISLELPTKS